MLGSQPPPRGQTNTCENITLPQTSFAGGKESILVRCVLPVSKATNFCQYLGRVSGIPTAPDIPTPYPWVYLPLPPAPPHKGPVTRDI